MAKRIHETQRLSFTGAVDADGHVLEPPDLWETYIDPKYRDRALRIVLDDNGLEELEIGGKRSLLSRRGFPSTLGAMGDPDLRSMQFDPARTYMSEAPFGSMDPFERVKVLDAEGIDAVVLYTSTFPWPSIQPLSPSGRRGLEWGRGNTSSSSGCWHQ
jgi:hypothetical protein